MPGTKKLGTSIGRSGTGKSTTTVGGNEVEIIGNTGGTIGPVFPVFVSGTSIVISSTGS